MSELQSEFLFEMKLDVSPGLSMGKTPFGKRWFAEVTGGSFAGPRMRGRALPGGGDCGPITYYSSMYGSLWKPMTGPLST
jgi:hypothetical protein